MPDCMMNSGSHFSLDPRYSHSGSQGRDPDVGFFYTDRRRGFWASWSEKIAVLPEKHKYSLVSVMALIY